jgi:GNAT superfamily N-acetyltransferase
MPGEWLDAAGSSLSAIAALCGVVVAGLSIREVRRIDSRAALRDANERDDALQARLDPMYEGLHTTVGRLGDGIPLPIRGVLVPFFVLYSDVFAADRDHLLGCKDNQPFLDEFAFWAQAPAGRSAWKELRAQTWPTGFVDHVDRVMLMPSPYPEVTIEPPENDWTVSVEPGCDLSQAAEVLLRLRDRYSEFPPSALDLRLPPLGSLEGRKARLTVYERWLSAEPVEQRWSAVKGTRVIGHVQVTAPHDYLVEQLATQPALELDPDDVLELGRLFVDPDVQQHGVGRQLVTYAVRFIEAAGKTPVLAVLDESARALALYTSMGWEPACEFDGLQGHNTVMYLPSQAPVAN